MAKSKKQPENPRKQKSPPEGPALKERLEMGLFLVVELLCLLLFLDFLFFGIYIK